MATLDTRLLDRLVFASMVEESTHRIWTAEEDQFLKDHLAMMTDAEIGAQLGRSEMSIHLRWSRDLHLPSRSKHPDVVTAQQAAQLLGIDSHKIAHWVDMGLIRGRLMPGERKIRLISRVDFRRWVLNPMNWVYFDPKKVRNPELKRMCEKRAARWGDEWWTTRRAADYHGVTPKDILRYITKLGRIRSFHLPVSLGGRHEERGWSNHFVLKSEAMQLRFMTVAEVRSNDYRFTPAADAWLLKARDELGMTFVAIGRSMKMGTEKYNRRTGSACSNHVISHRYRQLKARTAKKKGSRR